MLMDKKSISGLLAQLISKNEPKDDAAKAEGAGVETAVNEFLSGEGELHETTRAAVTRGGTPAAPPTPPRGAARPVGVRSVGARYHPDGGTGSAGSGAASDVAKLLSSKFGLSPAIANLIAPLLVKLVPSIGQAAGSSAAAKPKARRKAKPKTVSEARKKAKKKTAANPKKPAAKPAAKKKTPAKSGKK